jgi:hypothetical protein
VADLFINGAIYSFAVTRTNSKKKEENKNEATKLSLRRAEPWIFVDCLSVFTSINLDPTPLNYSKVSS